MADLPAERDPAAEMADGLLRLEGVLQVTAPDGAEDAWDRAVSEANRSARALARMGYYLLLLRESLPHGEFESGCQARGLTRFRAAEAMRVARFLIAAHSRRSGPNVRAHAHLDRLLDLGPAKLRTLAEFSPQDIDAQGEIDIDEVDMMTTRELRDKYRKMRQKCTQIQSLSHDRLDRIRELEAAAAPGPGRWPNSVARVRREAAAASMRAVEDIVELMRLAAEFPKSSDLGSDRRERERHLEAGARVLLLHLGGVVDVALDVLDEARELLGRWAPDMRSADRQPDPAERELIERLGEWRLAHLGLRAREFEARESAAIASGEIRRGRGRPRKAAAPGRPRKGAAK